MRTARLLMRFGMSIGKCTPFWVLFFMRFLVETKLLKSVSLRFRIKELCLGLM